jgi:outer membrane protein assembly factor BamB
VALGLGSGGLVESLLAQSKLHVVVIDPDASKVNAFRRRMDDAGLYGTRASAVVGEAGDGRLPPYLASVVVAEGLDRADASTVADVFRVLRPCGGAAYLPEGSAGALEGFARGTPGGHARCSRAAGFAKLERVGALPGSSSWTHQYADAANSVVSKDKLVKAPLGLLWFGGPPNDPILPRHGHGPSPQVAGGRLFIEGQHMLRAVDVYTGRLLWERKLPEIGWYYRHTGHHPGANEIGSNYVSLADGVYVKSPASCLRLDPATGKTVKEYSLPATGGGRARWGSILAAGDLLIAAASPVAVEGGGKAPPSAGGASPRGDVTPLVKKNDKWRYLAGSHPEGNWTEPTFRDAKWKTGTAGFGYGDGDDRTELKGMRNKYSVVYARKSFDVRDLKAIGEVGLMIRYDDAFIAYLNGKEVVRAGVGRGSGRRATGIKGHEAGRDFNYFEIKDGGKLLRAGTNVLALEGHNGGAGSSDFTLDPYLVYSKRESARPETTKKRVPDRPAVRGLGAALADVDYSSASRTIVAMERESGRVLWKRGAAYNFRHNSIVAGGGKVFCIDGMSPTKMSSLRRRGVSASGRPTLYALDARSGRVAWKADDNVFGTFLNYSEEHDVLLQAGSRSRDRAKDDIGKGMVAYRGRDGRVLWKDLEVGYGGPCMLRHDTVITQGWACSLLDGKRKTRRHPLTGEGCTWGFTRNYGCNTVVGSEHLLTFRSAAAGYYDLERDSGTGNLGGFKSGCTSNLIVADGILNAPDYTRTCGCSYQNQSSLALVHMPDAEMWTFSNLKWSGAPVRRVGVNLGAPGDRLAANGTLWLDYPSVGGSSPNVPVTTSPAGPEWFRKHSSLIKGNGLSWVAASGAEGLASIRIDLGRGAARRYDVKLVFSEPDGLPAGARVFDVAMQGRPVLRRFDVARLAGGADTSLVRDFKGVSVRDYLEITLAPSRAGGKGPVLSGVEAVASGR